MEIKAKICKVMPSVEGEGRNGHYKFTPFIIEWDELENGRSFTQSAKVDFSEKTVKVADLADLVGTSERVLMSLSINVVNGKEAQFTQVTAFLRDDKYRVPRQY